MKLNAKQLRTCKFSDNQLLKKRTPIYFILENVYDTYNVGGLFRLADALNIEKIYLCGQMEIPPNSKIKKASIGTYKIIPWEYKTTAKAAIEDLRKQTQIQLIAVEQNKRSRHYSQIKLPFPFSFISW
jgi:tRNA G18 (ribose-2'-O)-methylase SpoU